MSTHRTALCRVACAGVQALLALVAMAAPSAAQENADCLYCHEEHDLVVTVGEEEISGFVDQAVYGASVHGALDCVACHQDLIGAEMPHEWDLARVSCADCHEDQATEHAASLHGQALGRGDEMAPRCDDCHGKHDIRSHREADAPTAIINIPALCGRCHKEGSPVSRTHEIEQERIFENYSQSIHGAGLFEKGLTVTAVCTSCHTSHSILPHTDPRSSIHPANVATTCAACHAQIERVHRKVVEGRLWEEEPHKIPSCVDCHEPHEIRQVFYPSGMANRDCMSCHAARELTTERDGRVVSLYVNEGDYSVSVHSGTACAQCHTDVSVSLERPCATVTQPVDCSICHAGEVDAHRSGMHGQLAAQGDPDAPVCLDCHDKHATLGRDQPESSTFPRNVPDLCGRCHLAGGQAARRIADHGGENVAGYLMSTHGKGLEDSGLLVTATCSSCHGAHEVLPPDDPRSSVSDSRVADTCGTCHYGIEERFQTSIHWPGNSDTDERLPTCKDCHSSHDISRIDEDAFRFSTMQQCGGCHEQEAESFYETLHGKVSRLGTLRAAKCYDCHGTHSILPASHPGSALSEANIIATCGNCHDGAHRQFTGFLNHATHKDPQRYPALYWTFWTITSLLIATMTVALLHSLCFLVRLLIDRKEWRAHKLAALRPEATNQKLYRRFDRYQRTLHLLMVISFLLLALTGMTLKFSFTPWASTLSAAMGGFDTTSTLHRVAAIVLMGVFVVHVRSALRFKRERKRTWLQVINAPDSILFNKRDLTEVKETLRWFFGRGPRPRYGRYTYWEKFDYFAVFWGVAVIGLSGFVLWFPEAATLILPGWAINVATIIHSDEALLAVAFIFTIHFFNANFRPDKFPMDMAMFTGRMTLDELKYERPAEYDLLVDSGELEKRLVDPLPVAAVRSFRLFASLALITGVSLIVLIAYALLQA